MVRAPAVLSVVLLPPAGRDFRIHRQDRRLLLEQNGGETGLRHNCRRRCVSGAATGSRAANPAEPMVTAGRCHRVDAGVFRHSVAQCVAATGGVTGPLHLTAPGPRSRASLALGGIVTRACRILSTLPSSVSVRS